MNKIVFITGALNLAFAASAQADIIRCTFSEPFVTTIYSMAQQSLTVINDVTEARKVIKNVSFQIKSSGQFEIVAKDGKVLQTLKLTGQGSHGMGGAVYPYEVKDPSMEKNVNKGIGGCSSNYLKEKLEQY